nr:MAG TPA: hypothetical protein [Caudoviricetes sp.]
MKDGRIACVNPEAKYLDPNNYLDYPGLEKVNEWLVDLEKRYNQTITESTFIQWVEAIQMNKNRSPRDIYSFLMNYKSMPDSFSVEVFVPMYRHAKALLAIYKDHELSNFIYVKKDLTTVYLQSQADKPEPKETVPVTYEANNRNHVRSALHHSVNSYDINNDGLNDNKVVALETAIKPTLSKTDELRKDTIRNYLIAGNEFLSKFPFDVEIVREFQDRELINLWEQHLAYLKVHPIARGYD